MSKKPQISESAQKQFNKPQFQPGDYVFFTWLGVKKYGYVKTTKQTGWGTQYMVESNGTRYPCGIQIKGEKTAYTTGCIFHEDTISIGNDELKRRTETAEFTGYITRRDATPQDAIGDTSSAPVSRNIESKPKSSGSNNGRKNAVKSSNTAVRESNNTKRSKTKLDEAVERQRNFLNGFVKRD